jgi:hypothetical protein
MDSTRGLEFIRPIETLPLVSVQRLDQNLNKMSMIHEEEYPNELHPREAATEKSQKTTSENILDFHYQMAGTKSHLSSTPGYNRFRTDSMSRGQGFIPVQELDQEGEEGFLTSQSKFYISNA